MKHLFFLLKKEIKKHTFDYLLLTTAGVFFLIAINLFKGERFWEFIILLTFASFYIIWGMYHHLFGRSFHLKTVIEYILIAFTAIFILKIIILP